MLACNVWALLPDIFLNAQIGIFNLMEGNLSATFNGITLEFTLVCQHGWRCILHVNVLYIYLVGITVQCDEVLRQH